MPYQRSKRKPHIKCQAESDCLTLRLNASDKSTVWCMVCKYDSFQDISGTDSGFSRMGGGGGGGGNIYVLKPHAIA